MASTLDTRNFTKAKAPSFPFGKALTTILPGWELSLVFAGKARAKHLNQVLRKKDYVPNVLSYQTGTKSGEIVICLEEAKKQAPSYGMTYPHFVGFLFIHGMLHLKGARHGTTMDTQERALLARFIPNSFYEATHRHRH